VPIEHEAVAELRRFAQGILGPEVTVAISRLTAGWGDQHAMPRVSLQVIAAGEPLLLGLGDDFLVAFERLEDTVMCIWTLGTALSPEERLQELLRYASAPHYE
jgi:hypothetical protein